MLIRSIDTFLRRHAMAPTLFGRLAANDPRLVFDLRNGRSPGHAMHDRCRDFMARIDSEGSAANVR